MKFGGHETFFIRPGWLTKGLYVLREQEQSGNNNRINWGGPDISDALGVGRNMAKSIGWWLALTGLSEHSGRGTATRLSPLGRVILAHDSCFSRIETWWFIHLMLTTRDDRIFGWFFRTGSPFRFRRNELISTLETYLSVQGEKTPAQKTLNREIAMLLQTYGRQVPAPAVDPEDNSDCPLRNLGLLTFQTGPDCYIRRAVSALPPHVIAAGASLWHGNSESARFDISPRAERSLARGFNLGPDAFTRAVTRAAEILGPDYLTTRFLAGERVSNVLNAPIHIWAEICFSTPESVLKITRGCG